MPITMAMRIVTACGSFFFCMRASPCDPENTRPRAGGRLSAFGACCRAIRRHKCKRPTTSVVGRLTYRALAMTYFLTGNPQYHRRGVVSRSCSGWEGVGPTRYGRQEFWEAKVASNWIEYCIVFARWTRVHTDRKVIE